MVCGNNKNKIDCEKAGYYPPSSEWQRCQHNLSQTPRAVVKGCMTLGQWLITAKSTT